LYAGEFDCECCVDWLPFCEPCDEPSEELPELSEVLFFAASAVVVSAEIFVLDASVDWFGAPLLELAFPT
jgi:hypothetical protein